MCYEPNTVLKTCVSERSPWLAGGDMDGGGGRAGGSRVTQERAKEEAMRAMQESDGRGLGQHGGWKRMGKASNFCFCFLYVCFLFILREKEREWGDGQRERKRESQAGSAPSAQRPLMWDSSSRTLRS